MFEAESLRNNRLPNNCNFAFWRTTFDTSFSIWSAYTKTFRASRKRNHKLQTVQVGILSGSPRGQSHGECCTLEQWLGCSSRTSDQLLRSLGCRDGTQTWKETGLATVERTRYNRTTTTTMTKQWAVVGNKFHQQTRLLYFFGSALEHSFFTLVMCSEKLLKSEIQPSVVLNIFQDSPRFSSFHMFS